MANNDNNNQDDEVVDIEIILADVDFPATRDELVEAARDTDASDAVIVVLETLPDREYASTGDVSKEIENSDAADTSGTEKSR